MVGGVVKGMVKVGSDVGLLFDVNDVVLCWELLVADNDDQACMG